MVKIRYSELPAGLHVAASADPNGIVVYLQPGLTPAQRRAALIRVRSSARVGQGPTLPRQAMARAIAADKVRTNARIGAAAARRHPMLFVPPVIVLAVSAIGFMFMSVQPLTAVTRGNVMATIPTLGLTAPAAGTPSHPQGQLPPLRLHHRHRHAATGSTRPASVLSALPASCATLQAPSSRWPWPTVPSRRGSPLTTRCQRRFQRWARTHQF
jgi:hypothetical protein